MIDGCNGLLDEYFCVELDLVKIAENLIKE